MAEIVFRQPHSRLVYLSISPSISALFNLACQHWKCQFRSVDDLPQDTLILDFPQVSSLPCFILRISQSPVQE